MNHKSALLSKILLGVVISLTFFMSLVTGPVRADDPTDGRINVIPWVNSHGAVVVYCVDSAGRAGRSFTGGGIAVTDSTASRLLFATEAQINLARTKVN